MATCIVLELLLGSNPIALSGRLFISQHLLGPESLQSVLNHGGGDGEQKLLAGLSFPKESHGSKWALTRTDPESGRFTPPPHRRCHPGLSPHQLDSCQSLWTGLLCRHPLPTAYSLQQPVASLETEGRGHPSSAQTPWWPTLVQGENPKACCGCVTPSGASSPTLPSLLCSGPTGLFLLLHGPCTLLTWASATGVP